MRKFSRFALLFLLIGLLALTATTPLAAEPYRYENYDQSLFLDTDWYHQSLIATADLWNGGLDGQSGFGAYRDDFTGFFYINLDRQWRQKPLDYSTPVAQSRGIYMNVEAYRASGEERFLTAVNRGVESLLTDFYDPEFAGFYWGVAPDGTVIDSQKQGYANVHPIFALAQAYSVTQNPAHLEAALNQLELYQSRFLDNHYDCAIHPGFNRDYSELIGVNNIDVFTHYFESLLILFDVTEGDTKAEMRAEITKCGDFLVNFLYHDQDGFPDRGYVAYNYDESWQPSQLPYTRDMQWTGARQASTGHNIELAYLLSRAVERGFDAEWLTTADKLIKFCLEYAIHPEFGGMIYEITDYDGQALEGNPDNAFFIYWPQAETARALLHFIVVRGRADYQEAFKKVETIFDSELTDQEFGGIYPALFAVRGLRPQARDKGDIWKTNYHESMYFSEILRLQAQYPEAITALNQGH